MELHPLPGWPPDLGRLAAYGEAARIARHGEPRTVAEVLAAASEAMDREDAELERARDPVAWLRAERRKHSLFWRLFGRR